jgi:CBS-domain-containing membrane protein
MANGFVTEKLNFVAESASKLYRPSDLHLSAKLVPTFANRGCHMVSVTDSYGRILGFQG